MNLQGLFAENFLKFERIELADLPQRGLIGIRGPNESGKTSLGEAIAFALFGRTLRLPAEERWEAIRWGSSRATVRARLRLEEGRILEVRRDMDDSGGYGALLVSIPPGASDEAIDPFVDQLPSLSDAGSEEGESLESEVETADAEVEEVLPERVKKPRGRDPRQEILAALQSDRIEVLARGPSEVDQALAHLLGFDFEAFRYAFYLGQKEVDLLLQSAREGGALERMVGLESLEASRVRAETEAEEFRLREAELRMRLRLQNELLEEFERGDKEVEKLELVVGELKESQRELETEIQEVRREKDLRGNLKVAREDLRTYGLRLDLTARLRSLAGRIRFLKDGIERLEEDVERARADQDEALDYQRRHRTFLASLRELEEFVRAKGRDLQGVGGSGSKEAVRADADFLLGMVREKEKTIARRKAEMEDAENKVSLAKRWGVGLAALSLLGVAWMQSVLPLILLGFVIFGHGFASILEERRKENENLLQEDREDLDTLKTRVSALEKTSTACEDFQATSKADLLDGLQAIQSESLFQMAQRLEERFPRFWTTPETFSESYAQVLRDAVEQRGATLKAKRDLARDARERARSYQDRFENLVQISGLPRPEDAAFVDLKPQGLLDSIQVDLARTEEVTIALGSRPNAATLSLESPALKRTFQTLDPQAEKRGLDPEGWSLVLKGAPPPSLGRDQDPSPWAQAQWQLAQEALRAEELGPEALETTLGKKERDIDRIQVELKVLEERLETHRIGGPRPTLHLDQMARLETEVEEVSHGAKVRQVLADVLAATVTRIRSRLFPAIAEYAAKLLPRITGGRHSEVQISRDGRLQIFAPEAGEFVPIDALSGGAQDQFLLALRLAFASAVVCARSQIESSQLLFLDEPLASSDEERGKAFMQLLEDRSEVFEQVFVVTHRLAGDETYDWILRLDPESAILDPSHIEITHSAPPQLEAVASP